ncbi:MAG: MBOAT family protein, partial [Planctomycetota bacterium]
DFLPQLEEKHLLAVENFWKAIPRIMGGLVLKCVVADSLAPLVASCLEGSSVTTTGAMIGALAFGIQIYGDFAGYSHIAIGLAQLFGYDLMENFRAPYTARDPRDFWRRWHISLSTWLRDYLYIPLGGSRQGAAKTMRALFLTMILGGLWHGASANFLLWGAFHGAWLIVHRLSASTLKGFSATPGYALVSWGCTQYLVFLSWILFRVKDLSLVLDQAGAYLRVWDWNRMDVIRICEAHPQPMAILGVSILWQGLVRVVPWAGNPLHPRSSIVPLQVFVATLLLLWLTPEAASAFIYFQF